MHCLYRVPALLCRAPAMPSNCATMRRDISSFAAFRFDVVGSNQHSILAHGCGFCTSGGSVPMFRHMMMPTDCVLIRCRRRHGGAFASSWRRALSGTGCEAWEGCQDVLR